MWIEIVWMYASYFYLLQQSLYLLVLHILQLLLGLLLDGLDGIYGDCLAIWTEEIGQLALFGGDGLTVWDQLTSQ